MTTPPTLPTSPPCWPGDKDWLDGKVELFEGLPSSMRAEWDADILDTDDKNQHDRIIERDDSWIVRFRVQLKGRLWQGMTGTWYFDLGFAPIGKGTSQDHFNLSEVYPGADLTVPNWTGCQTRCIEKQVTVPAGTIPAEARSTVYAVAAKFELRACKDELLLIAGMEDLKEYLFT